MNLKQLLNRLFEPFDAFRANTASYYAIEKGDLSRGIAILSELIDKYPHRADFYWRRGEIFRHHGANNRALRDYDKAVELNSNCAEAYYCRGQAKMEREEWNAAKNDFDKAIQLKTKKIEDAYYQRAVTFASQGQINEAIADLELAMTIKPDFVEALAYRGTVLQAKGKTDQALSDFSHALQLNPEDYFSRLKRGEVLLGQGKLDEAILDLNRAIQVDPLSADAFCMRGMAWLALKDYEKALSDFNQAIHLDKFSVDSYVNRAWAEFFSGRFAEAIVDCQELLKLNPESLEAFYCLAWIKSTCPASEYRNGAEALDYAMKAMQKDTLPSLQAKRTLAVAYAENGSFEEAIAIEKEVVDEVNPEDREKERRILRELQSHNPYRSEIDFHGN